MTTIVIDGIEVEVHQLPADQVARARDKTLERKEKRAAPWAEKIEECMSKVNPALASGRWKKIKLSTDAKVFNDHVLMPLLCGFGNTYPGAFIMETKGDIGVDGKRPVIGIKPMEPGSISNNLRELQHFLQTDYDKDFSFKKDTIFGSGHGAVVKCVNTYVSGWRIGRHIACIFQHKKTASSKIIKFGIFTPTFF
jgi:hypothetical protein